MESTQKGQFYGSKSSQPGYVPRETFFIESPQMGRFYESEPARPWLYRQKLLIRDICPSTCLSWFLKKIRAKIDKQKKSIESTLWVDSITKKWKIIESTQKGWSRHKRVKMQAKSLQHCLLYPRKSKQKEKTGIFMYLFM
jgi:hypothetical protein